MTTAQSYFLTILADHLHRRPSDVKPDTDWDELIELAESHSLTAILYYQLKEAEPIYTKLAQSFAMTQFSYANRVHTMGEIDVWFTEAGIEYFTVKGLDIAQLYPLPPLRSMCDCDIIVHTADKERAHKLLVAHGFDCQKSMTQWVYCKNRMEYELHDHLLYDNSVANTPADLAFAEAVWDHIGGETVRHKLDWSYHFVFLLLHLKKHMLNRGVGLRQFMDLAVVVQNFALDWDWIHETLDTLELKKFADVCFALCERWFGVDFPGDCSLAEDFFEPATEQIFANGVFGFCDEENLKNHLLGSVKHYGKFRTVLRAFFPPYRDMSALQPYHFVSERPWLLPVAWVYRWFKLLYSGRLRKGWWFMRNVAKSEANIEKRDLTLRQWGL